MLHSSVHSILKAWFLLVENWGYLGIFLLMALESSVVPVPSEVVMPPAAYWASLGRMDFWGVVAAGTLGSYAGSVISYLVSRAVGIPLINKFGKYVFLSEKKVEFAQSWLEEYETGGVFVARLLPVVRHLISIPAGILKMDFKKFSVATISGAFLWCLVLSWFGREVIGGNPELLSSPEALIAVCKLKLHWFVGGALALGLAYFAVLRLKKRFSIELNQR